MKRVAIVIPTLLGGVVLEACLAALDRQTFRDFEVIVIDNGSVVEAPPADSLRFPVRVIRPGANIGFGAAVNLAAHATEATLIATLNDDTEADPAWLRELVAAMDSGSKVGMCASSIRLFSEAGLDSAGLAICLDGSSKQRRGAMPAEILFPSACAALYRRELLEQIGYFDSDFFLYCEDTDVGLRALWAGWECRYAPSATVRHRYSETARPWSALKAGYVERNRLWVALKSFPLPLLAIVPFASIVRYAFQWRAASAGRGAAAEFLRDGQSLGRAARILARAHLETLRHLPSLLRKRAGVRGTRRIGSFRFMRLVMRNRMTLRNLASAG